MQQPRLLKQETNVWASKLDGLAYIKDSKGKTANASLFTHIIVATKDNKCKVTHTVSIFDKTSPDYFTQEYTNYSDALNKYNALAQQFNGYR